MKEAPIKAMTAQLPTSLENYSPKIVHLRSLPAANTVIGHYQKSENCKED